MMHRAQRLFTMSAGHAIRREVYQRRFWHARRFLRLPHPLSPLVLTTGRVLSLGPALVEREELPPLVLTRTRPS